MDKNVKDAHEKLWRDLTVLYRKRENVSRQLSSLMESIVLKEEEYFKFIYKHIESINIKTEKKE